MSQSTLATSDSPGDSPDAHPASRTGRAGYAAVFAGLVALTALEVGVVRAPGIGHTATVVALVGLAGVKAALIGLVFMHLRYETRILRGTVLLPLLAPVVYALALMADAAWRMLR